LDTEKTPPTHIDEFTRFVKESVSITLYAKLDKLGITATWRIS